MADSPCAAATAALARLAECFVFRKLGVCYDYHSAPEAMPGAMLPGARDIRQSLPNPLGLGSGMADCALNNALLVDACALRLEIGFGTAEDERVLDRLIGGVIRLATIAPRNTVIRGLSPDGKSFYPQCGPLPVLYWAASAWRAATTATVGSESQGKIRNIVQHWMENLEQNKFQILNHDDAFNGGGWLGGVARPALLAVAAAVTGTGKWKEQALAALDLDATVADPAGAGAPEELFALQTALALLRETLLPRPPARSGETPAPAPAPDPLAGRIDAAMNRAALAAAAFIGRFKDFPPAALDETPDLDWHAIKEDGVLPWPRINQENACLAAAALAAVTVFLAPDPEIIAAQTAPARELLLGVPWERLWLGRALTPAVLLHALGVARGAWDPELKERQPAFDGTASLVERFLDPEYDNANPDKAGHSEPAPRREMRYLYGHGGNGEKKKGHNHGRDRGKDGRPGAPANGGDASAAPENGGDRPGRNHQRSRRHGKNRNRQPNGQNGQNGESRLPLKDFLKKKREGGNPATDKPATPPPPPAGA